MLGYACRIVATQQTIAFVDCPAPASLGRLQQHPFFAAATDADTGNKCVPHSSAAASARLDLASPYLGHLSALQAPESFASTLPYRPATEACPSLLIQLLLQASGRFSLEHACCADVACVPGLACSPSWQAGDSWLQLTSPDAQALRSVLPSAGFRET